jgi:hypothetical protein
MKRKPIGYWRDPLRQRAFFDKLAVKLKIQSPTDWYGVTKETILRRGGNFIVNYYGGSVLKGRQYNMQLQTNLWIALQRVYPEHTWKEYHRFRFKHDEKKGKPSSKSQITLFQVVKEMFPNAPVSLNYNYRDATKKWKLQQVEFDVSFDATMTKRLYWRFCDRISNIISGYLLTNKVFIPSLQLAFEYQGETHYISNAIYGSASKRQHNDKIKREIAKDEGITLISVPFWWDKNPASLAATIRQIRPDIEVNFVESFPIPTEVPRRVLMKYQYVPNVAQEYDESIEPEGWYV